MVFSCSKDSEREFVEFMQSPDHPLESPETALETVGGLETGKASLCAGFDLYGSRNPLGDFARSKFSNIMTALQTVCKYWKSGDVPDFPPLALFCASLKNQRNSQPEKNPVQFSDMLRFFEPSKMHDRAYLKRTPVCETVEPNSLTKLDILTPRKAGLYANSVIIEFL